MEIVSTKADCTACQACFNICPVQAITMKTDSEGFLYPYINNDKCIQCKQCQRACPSLNEPKKQDCQASYGAYVTDLNKRMQSSSGGIFAETARYFLINNGVVCGAAFDEQLQLRHIIIDNIDDLNKICGTKYLQSNINNTFKQIEKLLKSNKLVLFSGTPCQVAGLKSFLQHDYDNLLCIDLICHGVPSQRLFSRYCAELSPDNKIIEMSFRDKTKGISNVNLKYICKDGNVIREPYSDSPYINGFIDNYFNRPSCYQCKNKGLKRASDITLGDFWGVENEYPQFADKNGISAVLIHTDKGKYYFSQIQNTVNTVKTTYEQIAKKNICLTQSVCLEKTRNYFFSVWDKMSICDAISYTNKKIKGSITRRFARKIKSLLPKV